MKTSREGSAVPDLEQFRSYLMLLADLQLNPRLRVKEDASDIVQQAMLEAHRDFHSYCGQTDAELRGWLKTILTNNLISLARRYAAQKHDIVREVSLNWFEQSSLRFQQQLVVDQSSPSQKLMEKERSEQLADALLQLLDDERTAVVLKHFHDWSVVEIAQQLGRTNNAVAGLLRRGLKKLREHFNDRGQFSDQGQFSDEVP